jgi:hypothetical protein
LENFLFSLCGSTAISIPMLLITASFHRFSSGCLSVRPCSEKVGRLSTQCHASSIVDPGRVGGSLHNFSFQIDSSATCIFTTCTIIINTSILRRARPAAAYLSKPGHNTWLIDSLSIGYAKPAACPLISMVLGRDRARACNSRQNSKRPGKHLCLCSRNGRTGRETCLLGLSVNLVIPLV